jgi:hypothetical protein
MEVYLLFFIFKSNNTLFSKERIETLMGGVKQAKDATKPSGKENAKSHNYYSPGENTE